jgi:hypothetical protein
MKDQYFFQFKCHPSDVISLITVESFLSIEYILSSLRVLRISMIIEETESDIFTVFLKKASEKNVIFFLPMSDDLEDVVDEDVFDEK